MTECESREDSLIRREDFAATINARIGWHRLSTSLRQARGGRGVKSVEGLGLLPHWAPRTNFFSQRRSFDSIKENQTNQTCRKGGSFTGPRRRRTRKLGIYFPLAARFIFERLEKCREIQGGGRG